MKFLFVVIVGCFLVTSCTSVSKKEVSPGQETHFHFVTRAQIRDLVKNQNHSVNIELFSRAENRMRMEITGLLGFSIASVVEKEDSLSYAIYPKKQYYQGPSNENSFSPLFSIPLDPKNILKIAFDRPLVGEEWKCGFSLGEKATVCMNGSRKTQVRWIQEEGGSEDHGKTVSIEAPQFSMKWYFEAPERGVELGEDIFELSIPPGYQKLKLN